jgi:hypothetical protein
LGKNQVLPHIDVMEMMGNSRVASDHLSPVARDLYQPEVLKYHDEGKREDRYRNCQPIESTSGFTAGLPGTDAPC